ncbi:TPA: hypothetical protein OTY99_003099 [Citrobacter freundii]|nr:hypothetical protein [Citrobacter freundii]HEI8703816.1 hypothetical protein [Citrobacter freundii]
MSRAIGIYIVKEKFPPTNELRASIIQAGFPCVLDDEFGPLTFSGFLPCPVNGSPSGFEYIARKVDSDELNELNTTFIPDLVLVLSTGKYELEWVSALATACCIASLAGGLVVDDLTGDQYFTNNASKWAKSQMLIVRS